MERLIELCKGCGLKDIWNMDESSCFSNKRAGQKGNENQKWKAVEAVYDCCILVKLNQKMIHQERSVILLMDNAAVHPISLKKKYDNIKIVFLPQHTTSCLQPLDAGIIQNFKVKYRKKLVRFVLTLIAENLSESEIAFTADILQVIQWTIKSWN